MPSAIKLFKSLTILGDSEFSYGYNIYSRMKKIVGLVSRIASLLRIVG